MAAALDLYVQLVEDFDAENHTRECPAAAVFFVYDHGTQLDAQYEETGPKPRVIVRRPDVEPGRDYSSPVDVARCSQEPLAELIAVAHELGHHHSWLMGTYSRFDDAVTLEKFCEEVRAWRLGRKLLGVRRFTEWPAFDDEAALRIEEYRSQLGIDVDLAKQVTGDIDAATRLLPALTGAG